MNGLLPRPLKVEHEFTDARLPSFGGWSALALTAERPSLLGDLAFRSTMALRKLGPWPE